MEITVESLAKMIASSLESSDTGYFNHIQNAVELIWGKVTETYRFDFMRSIRPHSMAVVADNMQTVASKKDIGHPIGIVNADWKPLYEYRNMEDFKKSIIEAAASTTTIEFNESTAPVIFTFLTVSSGKSYFLLHPKPVSGTTVYLDYLEAGVKSNINKCPNSLGKAIMHGVKSIMAPPKSMKVVGGKRVWETIASIEQNLFERELTEALATLRTVPAYDNQSVPSSNWMFQRLKDV